jgi:hypothetical protein
MRADFQSALRRELLCFSGNNAKAHGILPKYELNFDSYSLEMQPFRVSNPTRKNEKMKGVR